MSPCICNPRVCVVKSATSWLERSRQVTLQPVLPLSLVLPTLGHVTSDLLAAYKTRTNTTTRRPCQKSCNPSMGSRPACLSRAYPIPGLSMFARGEIASLISGVADPKWIFSASGSSGTSAGNDPTCSLSSLDDRALYDHGPTWSGG
jgi:hypothetical protein